MGGKASLILVIGFSMLMTYTLLNMNSAGTRAISNMSKYSSMTSSHNLAVAGANMCLSSLYQDTTRFPSHSKSYANAQFYGSLNATTVRTGPGSKRITSIATSVYAPGKPPIADTVIVDVFNNGFTPFTSYAWMTNIENGVYWITGDTVWGTLFSNDNLTVDGSPVFMHKVATAKGFWPGLGKTAYDKYGNKHTNKAIFYDPPVPTTGAPEVKLPNNLSDLSNAAQDPGTSPGHLPGKYYTTNITVKLDPGDGTAGAGMAIVSYVGMAKPDTIKLNAGFNGVIGSTKTISVEGVLNGKLTLAALGSSSDIYITNDITYHTARTSPSNGDLLGLAAGRDVIMANNTPNDQNRDHYVDANIFALGSWRAEDHDSGGLRGNLRVFGSIVQNSRGAVGTFSGGTISTGYLKRYTYDDRLSGGAFYPPSYPGFNLPIYTVTNWWESGGIMELNEFYSE